MFHLSNQFKSLENKTTDSLLITIILVKDIAITMFTFSRKIVNLTRNVQLKNKLPTQGPVIAGHQQGVRNGSSYQGDGKTKVSILNQELELGLMINSYSQVGFRLNNGLNVIGPMAIFPRTVLSWNVGSVDDINEESLSLFYSLDPKIEMLVLGIGDAVVTPAISAKINSITRKFKLNVEILGTEMACSTFNFLNAEQRLIAGGFIPPTMLRINENDILKTKVRHDQLYGPVN
ncbi:NADH dehydrogenase [ubiquinone] 1 alpha subcomplex assembly factor 3 [Pseudolycoriella hygida]|uniref:NADH dehydrogenase [ubiquinone] 1 alpha subcomplex assembly factor 3 n=1 Tax=Pseudolycoriella hygida TaxID=35572 RepID=A0A9Q0NGX5_9DIPT|nr:NADH dehydrogenase [ubiquinone] 1 alpha subcomplex assembly factor 3 [Pseudolycoriella hygida]